MIQDWADKPFNVAEWDEHLRQFDERAAKRAAHMHPQKKHVLDIIQEAGRPIKTVEVANQFGREASHKWDSRTTKANLRLLAFRFVGELVREFIIIRHNRKWVLYLGPNNPLRQAWLQRIEETIRNFPKPNL